MLTSLDTFFIQHAYTSTLTKGASVQLVFGFEYAILLTIVMNTLVKYVLHSIDLHSENPWENKAVFVLYTELAVTLIRVLLYILFFVIMVRIYTLPLFAVRPMYLTMRAFKKAFNDVVLSRRAIHNMDMDMAQYAFFLYVVRVVNAGFFEAHEDAHHCASRCA